MDSVQHNCPPYILALLPDKTALFFFQITHNPLGKRRRVFNFEVCISSAALCRRGHRAYVKLRCQYSDFVKEKADLCAVRRDRSDPNCLSVFVVNRFPPVVQFTAFTRL